MPMKTRASSRKVVKFKYVYSMYAPRYALCDVLSYLLSCYVISVTVESQNRVIALSH